ncbi:hypothetical protein BKA91DRAFT_144252 [Yarrowia lipolytica]|nr:hypothetical protein BKA91DRAFT_144252 [Yarrowia lipolytica]
MFGNLGFHLYEASIGEAALLPLEPAAISSSSLDAPFPQLQRQFIAGVVATSSDKHDIELLRLQGLSSHPYVDEDHVPQYKEGKAPEEVVVMQLNELASVPLIEGEIEEVDEGGFFDASSEFSGS